MISFVSLKATELAMSRIINSKSGRVISVHDNVFNIITDVGLVSVQNTLVPLTPFSLVINSDLTVRNLALSIDEIVHFSLGSIYGNNFKIFLEPICIKSSLLPKNTNENNFASLSVLGNSIKTNLELRKNHLDGLKDMSLNIRISDGKISVQSTNSDSDLVRFVLKSIDKSNIEDCLMINLTKLIGLGYGLTPSVDDFIIGLLSIFSYYISLDKIAERSNQLQNLVMKNLKSTNIISAAFLECATQNKFSEPVNHLYKLLNLNSSDEMPVAIDNLINIGHTSGTDTVNGILFGIKLINYYCN